LSFAGQFLKTFKVCNNCTDLLRQIYGRKLAPIPKDKKNIPFTIKKELPNDEFKIKVGGKTSTN